MTILINFVYLKYQRNFIFFNKWKVEFYITLSGYYVSCRNTNPEK